MMLHGGGARDASMYRGVDAGGATVHGVENGK
jgi:hypothetical protein